MNQVASKGTKNHEDTPAKSIYKERRALSSLPRLFHSLSMESALGLNNIK